MHAWLLSVSVFMTLTQEHLFRSAHQDATVLHVVPGVTTVGIPRVEVEEGRDHTLLPLELRSLYINRSKQRQFIIKTPYTAQHTEDDDEEKKNDEDGGHGCCVILSAHKIEIAHETCV